MGAASGNVHRGTYGTRSDWGHLAEGCNALPYVRGLIGAANDHYIRSGIRGCIGFDTVVSHRCDRFENLPGNRCQVPDGRMRGVDDGVHAVGVGFSDLTDPGEI